MHRHWNKTILPLIEKIKPKHIVEIGSATGINTNNILDYCRHNNSKLTAIDPKPKFDVNELKDEYGEKFEFFEELSLNALPFLEKFDIILIDGDHNWYTVFSELKSIEQHYQKENGFPIIILHDICWPYGRRDLYYNPDTIPNDYLLPYAELGMIPNQKELSKDKGMGLNYKGFNNALYEGGDKNGVLTAVEDFIHESPLDLIFYSIPAYHGLGILFLKNNNIQEIVENIIDYPSIMEDLEKHYLKVITSDMRGRKNQLIKKLGKKEKELKSIADNNVILKKKIEDNAVVIKSLKKKDADNAVVIKSLKKKDADNAVVIKSLSKKVTEIEKIKDIEIVKLTNEKNNEIKEIIDQNQNMMKSINKNISEFKFLLMEKDNQNKILIKENDFFNMSICEKDNQIKSLNEEIKILKSIIKEKDKTIDSLIKHN